MHRHIAVIRYIYSRRNNDNNNIIDISEKSDGGYGDVYESVSTTKEAFPFDQSLGLKS
jgi:hypothetical protein